MVSFNRRATMFPNQRLQPTPTYRVEMNTRAGLG
jgi:hypothetical protein